MFFGLFAEEARGKSFLFIFDIVFFCYVLNDVVYVQRQMTCCICCHDHQAKSKRAFGVRTYIFFCFGGVECENVYIKQNIGSHNKSYEIHNSRKQAREENHVAIAFALRKKDFFFFHRVTRTLHSEL